MYRIIGANGREYGPVAAEQLLQWVAEGRVNARTQALAPGATEWRPLGAHPDFARHFATPPLLAAGPEPIRPGRRTNGMALAGLVFGILSLACCCGCPFGVLGLIFSAIAWAQIDRHPELYEGRGLAVAGLILSAASLLLGSIVTLLHLALSPGGFEWHFNRF